MSLFSRWMRKKEQEPVQDLPGEQVQFAQEEVPEQAVQLPPELQKQEVESPPLQDTAAPEITVAVKSMPFPQEYTEEDLLRLICEKDASDLHISAGAPPIIRLHGDLIPLDVPLLTDERARKLILPLLSYFQKEKLINSKRVDFTYEFGETARFRTNVYLQYHGLGAALRLIPHRIPTLDEMSFPAVLKTISLLTSGLCVVTGPSGCGKSTTLAAMINYINDNRSAHIITIEDPIEFFHDNKKCLIDHREVGTHANSFSDAVRAALREDPDIILVGEMRDLETIYQAVKAAETGCLVFATLHTNSAPKTVDRIIDVFPAKQQGQIRSMLSVSLRAVISQQLLKRADETGRIAAFEILISTTGLPNLIREDKTNQILNFMNMWRSLGMQSMDTVLLELVRAGTITAEEAKERASDQINFALELD